MQTKIGFFVIMLLSVAAIACAEPQDDHSQLIARVEGALEKCDWKIKASGGPKGLMLLHQAKMIRVLDELKAGWSVDPSEIAEVMKGHSS